jgi:hypothetical protein
MSIEHRLVAIPLRSLGEFEILTVFEAQEQGINDTDQSKDCGCCS